LAVLRLGAILISRPLTHAWMTESPPVPAWALAATGATTARASEADTTSVTQGAYIPERMSSPRRPPIVTKSWPSRASRWGAADDVIAQGADVAVHG